MNAAILGVAPSRRPYCLPNRLSSSAKTRASSESSSAWLLSPAATACQ